VNIGAFIKTSNASKRRGDKNPHGGVKAMPTLRSWESRKIFAHEKELRTADSKSLFTCRGKKERVKFIVGSPIIVPPDPKREKTDLVLSKKGPPESGGYVLGRKIK